MREGDWIETFTGRKYYPLDPRPEDIDIRDIAHALALKCRFSGHCRQFYSVAQHSFLVSHMVPRAEALWGLLHDAAEAYLADVPTPVKALPGMSEFRRMETLNQAAVCRAFGLPAAEPEAVRRADKVMLITEARDLLPSRGESWGDWANEFPELRSRVQPLGPHEAELLFLHQYQILGGK